MILDDGGDLTNLVHDEYPQLLAGIKVRYCGVSLIIKVILLYCLAGTLGGDHDRRAQPRQDAR